MTSLTIFTTPLGTKLPAATSQQTKSFNGRDKLFIANGEFNGNEDSLF
jgi:hypothetical protein